MHGLYLLWWVGERGLSPAVVAAIIAAGDVAIFALEVPTGWVADRFGHRATLLAGSFVQLLGLTGCWLGRGVPELVVASLLIALGDTLRSGADQALLYRTCVALDRREDFLRITARTHAAGLVALVALTLLGGYVATTWGLAVGWALEVILCGVGGALVWTMVEPPPAPDSDGDNVPELDVIGPDVVRPADAGHAPATPLMMWRRLVSLTLPTAIVGAVAAAAAFLTQVGVNVTPAAATMLVAAITLAEAAGATLSNRCRGIGARGQWVAAVASLVAGFVLVSLPLAEATVAVAVVLAFVYGAAEPLRSAALQAAAADNARARTASVASACDMACSALALMLAGTGARRRR